MKSLAPYDENYALIHKRTLMVNSMVLTAMCEFIANSSSLSDEEVALVFGETANKIVSEMTDDEVNQSVNQLITKSWINNGVSSVVTAKKVKQ
ncbi:hypothetical protein [Nodularia sp. UHCC 0506]|uniref:hypothetical protein n=1 Tax=Nodularia sp. UHCC 0506 TaxID=3110243 RepID=UPI002B20AB8A|nr:hypothetical protein [Nodularia sp. UHCC 0506]MEA5515524.1 hypothetical protein [Nodularia sp. UHCC 0506]